MNQTMLTRAALVAALLGGSLAATSTAAQGGPGASAPAEVLQPAPVVATGESPEDAMAARQEAYEERVEQLTGRRAERPERPAAPEGVPTREEIDRYVEQRRQEVDAQLRATDPWGQYRRDWLEGRRQFRRDTRDWFRAMPGGPGYPWGPVAPYYGSPWGDPVAPLAPSREAMDEYFQRQHRAIEQRHGQGGLWTPYMEALPGGPGAIEERALRQNPWAPPVPRP